MKQVAHHQRADAGHQADHQQSPEQCVGQQGSQLRPHPHIAADQQVETGRKIVALNAGDGAHAGALDGHLVERSGIADDAGPALQISGDAVHPGIDKQIDRVVIQVLGDAVLDGDDQAGQPALVPALRQALGIGMDRRVGLPVE